MASPRTSNKLRPRGSDIAALVKCIASGDKSAFASLYDTTSALIYGLLLRILGSSQTAEQVLVAVYQEAWKQAPTYDDEREKPMTWLIAMARSNAIARLRAGRGDQQRQACRLKIAETTNPKTSEIDSHEQRIARSGYVALPPVQQQIIELAYFSGLRQNEIAARLGLSLRSVQAGMRAGMMRLRELPETYQLHLLGNSSHNL